MQPLDLQDNVLAEEAKKLILGKFVSGKHHVACVLYCPTKKFTSAHLDIRGFDVCAEPIAISNALAENIDSFKTIVAASLDPEGRAEVINPCGNCRQMLLVYAPNIDIIVNSKGSLMKAKPSELLPVPY